MLLLSARTSVLQSQAPTSAARDALQHLAEDVSGTVWKLGNRSSLLFQE